MQMVITHKNQKLGDLTVYRPVEIPSCLAASRAVSLLWIQNTIREAHPKKRWMKV